MLDSETKRRIDNCRDILVGKVPDPKSQVEQITIALIYKFMDDMDAQAEELGGKRSFFINGFEKYGWSKLLAPEMGGQDTLNLYSEAITKMTENTHLPELFRDIFKNAYLPYRDPETLRAFLKEINTFSYDHSERLGDAFEYLLSVLGSQGDAGQFRTPRHIIDFIVKVINPQKHESILDPACGTAGFLISAWKYILENNKTNKAGDKLKPEERAKLASNIHGYDISPDMVRLSRANLYLHGFTDPHIDEYDTLTSEDKWNEYYDVILANPPFMSPKGGIKPHKKFSIAASRSEVLFVDYIHEHLTPTGRAGIIVPEGIIFQGGTAYKSLREMLVKNSLVAVVSLPAGVFQPYSGVKTSILILDKRLAKQTDKVLFVKINNDGFALGAQRRLIEQNDLPIAAELLSDFFRNPSEFEINSLAQPIDRDLITQNPESSFSADRYNIVAQKQSHFPHVMLGDVVEILDSKRKPITKHDRVSGPYPYYGATGIVDYVGDFIFDEELVLVGEDGAKWGIGEKTAFAISGKTWVNNHAHVLRPRRDLLLDIYLIEMLNQMDLSPYITGVTVPKLNQEKLRNIQIPLPPIDIQREIVTEIQSYQTIIDGARQVVDNYQPHISVKTDWPVNSIGDLCKPEYGFTATAQDRGSHRFIRITDINSDGELTDSDAKYIDINDEAAKYVLQYGDILVARTGATFGKTMLFENDKPSVFASYLIRLKFPMDRIIPKYYWIFAQSDNYWMQAKRLVSGGGQPQFNGNAIVNIEIPVPTLDEQKSIVEEIEAEQAFIKINRQLIRHFEAKIKAVIDSIWLN
ncbi:MAG: N-6 DNA methylase [Methylophilus sp.]|nr:N-6 DNA methylase [Methylophilus sp.]